MNIPLSVRMKSFFARDKDTFWWNHFTDEENELRRMDVWELAKVINEVRGSNLAGEAEKLIVAEHMLNIRLAKIQATASWGSGILGFVGAIIGAALSVSLTLAFQSPQDLPRDADNVSEKSAVVTPEQRQQEQVSQPATDAPEKAVVEKVLKEHDAKEKQSNVATKP